MTTRHLVSLVTGVLILSVLFPIGLSLWLAHRQVEKRFNEELDIFSSRVALRTERVSDQAKAALTHIASFKGEPCSSAHLLAMRRVSYSFRYVQEVLYLKNSIPVCSSLEKESHIPAFPPPMKITRDGYRAWFTDAPRDKCTRSCAINGIHAAFHYLKKNYISGCVMTVPTGW